MPLTAAEVNVPLEALFDRTACLVPDRQIFTVDGTWTKPAHALWVEFLLIGNGYPGGSSTYPDSGGAGGGASGAIVRRVLSAADVPASLTVNVPQAPGDGVASAANGAFLVRADVDVSAGNGAGGDSPNVFGGVGGLSVGAESTAGGNGGASNAVSPAENGFFGGYGYTVDQVDGGARGSTPTPPGFGGLPGRGYGAGGGGAGGSGGGGAANTYGGGGGAGAGGYGDYVLAAGGATGRSGAGVAAGGAGAPGLVVITTWRGRVV